MRVRYKIMPQFKTSLVELELDQENYYKIIELEKKERPNFKFTS